MVLKFYALPAVPYDFASSQASFSLSHLMRVIADIDPKRSVNAIIGALNEALQKTICFYEYNEEDSLLAQYIDLKG